MRLSLPIDPLLPQIVESLRRLPNLVLQADPGAGKTTRVPPALLEAGLFGDGECWILEPRRLAARLAATRVADGVAPDKIDWRAIPVFSDFLFHYGAKPEPAPSEPLSPARVNSSVIASASAKGEELEPETLATVMFL